jgi:hypothetical protein
VNNLSPKNAFWTMLQLPISLGLMICTFAEMHFTYWMLALENPLSHPMTDLATKRAKTEQGTMCLVAEKVITQDHNRVFKGWLLSNNDCFIERFRVRFEANHANLMAEGRRRDPHLYAVLKPTRSENVVRICGIFRALTTAEQAKIIATNLAAKPCSNRP